MIEMILFGLIVHVDFFFRRELEVHTASTHSVCTCHVRIALFYFRQYIWIHVQSGTYFVYTYNSCGSQFALYDVWINTPYVVHAWATLYCQILSILFVVVTNAVLTSSDT